MGKTRQLNTVTGYGDQISNPTIALPWSWRHWGHTRQLNTVTGYGDQISSPKIALPESFSDLLAAFFCRGVDATFPPRLRLAAFGCGWLRLAAQKWLVVCDRHVRSQGCDLRSRFGSASDVIGMVHQVRHVYLKVFNSLKSNIYAQNI